MSRRLLVVVACAVTTVLTALPSRSQEATKPEAAKPETPEPPKPGELAIPPPRSRRPPALLRVALVIARHQGERKVASVPYTMLLTSDGRKARLRMGVEVPITVATFSKPEDPKSTPMTSFQYRNVGTNIDAWAEERADGLWQLSLGVESSSIYTASESRTAVGMSETSVAPDRPLFRTFNVSLNPTLTDGQTVQTVASTDPVTGEVVRIDVTLTVVK